MATVTILNLTQNRIGVPAPINKVISGQSSVVIELVDDAELANSDKITGLIDAGFIQVTVGSDATVADELEIQANLGAGSGAIADTNTYYTTDTIDGAFDALGVQIGGDTDAAFNFTEANVAAVDDPVYTALQKMDLKWGDLAAVANTEGASLVGVEDAAASFVGTDVEAVLAELWTAATTGGSDAITDTNTYYTVDTVDGAFDALALQLGGLTDATFGFTEDNVVADNDALYAALDKLDLKWGDLASVANTEGASLVGIEDAGTLITAATVEGALAENRALVDTNTTHTAGDGSDHADVASNTAIRNNADITDSGTGTVIPVVNGGNCALTSVGVSETRTLAIPTFIGQIITLYHEVDGGDIDVTVATAFNKAGNTGINLAVVDDSISLIGAEKGGALVWRVLQNDGTTLS